MRLRELILQSWTALHRNRMRSALTMLGISWGVVSVVLLLAFGQGLGNGVVSAVGNIGNNVIVIWPGQTSMQAGGQRAGRPVHFEYEDVEAIRAEVPIIRAVSAESCSDFGYQDRHTRRLPHHSRCRAAVWRNAQAHGFRRRPLLRRL